MTTRAAASQASTTRQRGKPNGENKAQETDDVSWAMYKFFFSWSFFFFLTMLFRYYLNYLTSTTTMEWQGTMKTTGTHHYPLSLANARFSVCACRLHPWQSASKSYPSTPRHTPAAAVSVTPLLPPQTECLVQQSEQSKIERLYAHFESVEISQFRLVFFFMCYSELIQFA